MNPADPAQHRRYGLRRCHETDADFVVALIETVMRAHSEATWGRFDTDFHRAAFQDAFGRLDHSIVVCDGVAAGYLAVDHRPDAEYLQWLLLEPAFQKHGLGSAIVGDLIGRANATGKAMRLRVLPVNTGALRLYERLGFVVTGTEGDFVYMERAADAAAP